MSVLLCLEAIVDITKVNMLSSQMKCRNKPYRRGSFNTNGECEKL